MATTHTRNIARVALGASLALLALPGCQHDAHRDGASTIYGETFPADHEPRALDRFVQVQSAAAARADATLTAAHFDGRGGLNSLGRQKLDLMLRDDDASTPMVVYLDLPATAATASAATTGAATTSTTNVSLDAHRESVRLYLADRGVSDANLEFRAGPNLAYSHPARDGLRGLKKLEPATDAPAADESGTGPGAAANNPPGLTSMTGH